MALYHTLPEADLKALAGGVGLTLLAARGVPQGSINTNYLLETAQGRHFLRLTHQRGRGELDFEAALLAHLKAAGFPCPRPLVAKDGLPYQTHALGLVSVFPFLPGEELDRRQVTAEHAFRAGAEMGRMHRLGASFTGERTNPYSPEIVAGWIDGLAKEPDREVQEALPTIREGFARSKVDGPVLRGAIHADYFRDNVKWLGDRISAVFDFEMACTGPLNLDVGIGLCEWTFDEHFEPAKLRAYIDGYRQEQPAASREMLGLYELTLFGAVRFTCSRIRDFHLSKLSEGALTRKDWRRYLRRTRELLDMGEQGFLKTCGLTA